MRKILQLFYVFLCAGVLAACSSAPAATPLVVVSETADTRLIEHTFGQTEIPTQPQRVFALGEEGLLANLLDAGIKPVGSNVNLLEALPLFSAAELDGVALYQTSSQFSLEEIAKAEPDLIIGNVFFIHTAGYEKLSQIAPTIAIGGNDPLESYAQTLAAFGLIDKASADLAAFEVAAASLAQAIDAPARQVSVAAIYSGPSPAIFVDGPQTPPWLLKKLGVQFIPTEAEREGITFRDGRAFVSLERVDLLHGEELILLQNPLIEGEPEALAKIQQDPLWAQLPAVQNGQVSVLDRLGYPGLRGLYALLADVQTIFE
ncbi:MAG: ABC transporter substrate-binding protein [Anaerolineales bacterium]|nr:ABC transporter substrate-binding protein [Anaerolineales bacterium]